MKAYRRPDGQVQLFRPWENVARLNRSCDRLGLPRIDEEDGLQAIRELVKVDTDWVPADPGTSLYIRPFLYSTDPTLALHGVHEATFAIILSPSGSYFKTDCSRCRSWSRQRMCVRCAGNRRSQMRRKLCRGQPRGRPGNREGLFAGAVAGRCGAQIRRRGRRHERHVQDQRYRRHADVDRLNPAGRDQKVLY